jgi:dCMP deaminase
MCNQCPKWDQRFLELSRHISGWSKDPSTKVGAIIVDDQRRVVSMGYNGLPQGVEDTVERLENRNIKYKITIHAEKNALAFAKTDLKGMTIYTWPLMPCAACASSIIQSGIKRIVSPKSSNFRWTDDFILTEQLCSETGVILDIVDPDKLDFLTDMEKLSWQ